jgi:hypothetical protein
MTLSRLPTRCAHCKAKFSEEERGQRIHAACIDAFVAALKAKKELKAQRERRAKIKVEKALDRRKRESLKRIPDLIREAQQVFNKLIRARDAKEPCISCGTPPPDMSGLHAGRDAGHYRSTGSASHLRFHPDNCHAQCVRCNQWGAGRAVDYRLGLCRRIGVERVEALESSNAPHKWERDELIAIKALYVQKLKQLKGAT